MQWTAGSSATRVLISPHSRCHYFGFHKTTWHCIVGTQHIKPYLLAQIMLGGNFLLSVFGNVSSKEISDGTLALHVILLKLLISWLCIKLLLVRFISNSRMQLSGGVLQCVQVLAYLVKIQLRDDFFFAIHIKEALWHKKCFAGRD